jgi:hypothetical protein
MRDWRRIRTSTALCVALGLAPVCATAQPAQAAASQRILLDRVVAVVNNSAILASDVNLEMRLSALEPDRADQAPDAKSALDRIISRTIIQQQIRRGEAEAAQPTDTEVQARVTELRNELPACVRMHCASPAGWAAFLSANGLTETEAVDYTRLRLELLAFIQSRFQQGIRIAPEDIETYYSKTLLPQYPKGQAPPPLQNVSQRIEEILLQERVNNLFEAWLDNLRKQGDVEILDPALEPPGSQAATDRGDQ